MKLSLAWLNDYLDRPAELAEVAQRLGQQGFPVEEQEPVAGDWMLDAEVTSNRPDVLSHVGMAREIAAGSGRTLTAPSLEVAEADPEAVDAVSSVANEAAALCPRYTARVVRGVKVGPSPDWLVARLNAIGLRSVSNVVDVTNYVMMELGQPLHTFDLDRLAEQRIVVRQAAAGEAFTAIDGTQHELGPEMLVIADAQRAQAVAGVMGGLDSEVGEGTTNLLLESADFEPLSVRKTSRRLKLSSDSSYRFERGVDPAGVEAASRRAAGLILQLAGGTLCPGMLDAGPASRPVTPVEVTMRVSRCNALLGLELSGEQMAQYLAALMLDPVLEPANGEAKAVIRCQVPSFRLDLHREVDLIEEVARLHGLAEIAIKPKVSLRVRPKQPTVAARERLGQILAAHGYHETVTDTLMNPGEAEPFVASGRRAVGLDGSLSWGANVLRPSVLASLLLCRKFNQDRGNDGLRLFETAASWTAAAEDTRGESIDERRTLALLCDAPDAQEALRDIKGTLIELFGQLRGEQVTLSFAKPQGEAPGDGNFQPMASVAIDGEPVGSFGLLSGATQKRYALQTQVVAAEIELGALIRPDYPPTRVVSALPKFPGIERDLSVVIEESVSWRQIAAAVEQAQPELLESLSHVTTYRGKPIAKGRKSLTLRMVFRHPQKTLRHEEVDPQVEAVLTRLKGELGAELRGE